MVYLDDRFSIILRLGEDYALAWDNLNKFWSLIHLHGTRNYGWWLKRSSKCSTCNKVFPERAVGMLHMFRGLQ